MLKRLWLVAALLALAAPVCAQTGTLMPLPKFTGLDANGDPISGGKLCVYIAGTTTPTTTYSDVDLAPGHANTNPVILDSAGHPTSGAVFLSPGASYKFILRSPGSDATCATGSIVWSQDNVLSVPGSAANLDISGVAGETITALNAVYLSDGSGSKVAGHWYKADNTNTYSSSSALAVGMAPAAITSGASGTIRLAGQMTGLTVTTGSTYYVSTAGGITSTVPTNVRQLGVADSATTIILSPNTANSSECNFTIVGKVASYSAALCELVEFTSGSPITLTLPAASTCSTTRYKVGMKNDTDAIITIARTGSDTIDQAASNFSTYGAQYESFDFVCNAAHTGWIIR